LVRVDYQFSFSYRQLESGRFPIIQVRITRQDDPEVGIETEAYIDSGAEGSLFNGDLLAALEIELINNKRKFYGSTAGDSITAYLHAVRLSLPDAGDFNLEIGFSEGRIRRNLLGRDFFNLVQIGFREHQLEYYLHPTP
jgi:hypothetical protein